MSDGARGGAGLRPWWRSSLRVRVITTTMVIGLLIGSLLGTVMFRQIADGLVTQAVDTATSDAAQQVRRAQELFSAVDQRDNTSLNAAAQDIVAEIAPRDGAVRRALLVRSLDNDRDTQIITLASTDVSPEDVPDAVREALAEDPGNQQLMVTEVGFGLSSPVPAVVLGSRVDIPRAGPHDLFLIYPMDFEQSTLALLRGTFLVGGVLLLALVAGVAWVATRMVVKPVERVAAASRQLAAGDLDQRLPVRGSDELDQLAGSFNTMADSLRSQIRQLETLSRLQQRFVSDVSHELRTPLTTMRMAGEVLHASRDEFSPLVARSTELLSEELDRFEALLTELLEVSRYDSGAAVLELADADLAALAQEVVTGLESLATSRGSAVRVQAPGGRPVRAELDPRRVSRVVRNLVGNAIKYGEGRPVEVVVEGDDQTVSVTVRDHGVGLSKDQLPHVFERFWRGDPARTRGSGGSGLGLAIALDDARLHGGWLDADGVPGEGSVFRLTLPRHGGQTVPPPPPVTMPTGTAEPGPEKRSTPPPPPAATPPETPAGERPDDQPGTSGADRTAARSSREVP